MIRLHRNGKTSSLIISSFVSLLVFLLIVIGGCRSVADNEIDSDVTDTPTATNTITPIGTPSPTPTDTISPTNTSSPTPTAPPSPTITPSLTPASAFIGVDLLPFALGNTWTYSKEVFPNKDIWSWQQIRLEDGNAVLIRRRGFCKPGTYVETHKITERTEEFLEGVTAWTITIDSPENCQGRYEDAKEIFWYLDTESAGFFRGRGVEEAVAKATERIIFDPDTFGGGWEEVIADPPTQVRDFLLVLEALDSDKWGYRVNPLGSSIETEYRNYVVDTLDTVTTSTDTFDNCVEVIEEIKPKSESEIGDNPFDAGWTNHSYFCSEVGLVKEVQKDRDDEVTYVLELLSYTTPIKTKYSFEDDFMGWESQTITGTQAVIQVSQSDEIAKEGQYSLKVDVDLIGGNNNQGQGEVWVDMLANPLDSQILPEDLMNRTITAWVYAPVGSRGNKSKPNGFQLFVKDENWNSEYGPWFNVGEGYWQKISLTVSDTEPTGGTKDPKFDSSRVIAIGVKMGSGGGSTSKYQGPIYIDAVGW